MSTNNQTNEFGQNEKNTEQVAMPLQYQSVLVRSVAFLVDMFLVCVAILILYYILGIPLSNGDDHTLNIILTVVLYLYIVVMESESGQTFGKKLFKIKVVSLDGSPLSISQVLIRNALGFFERNPIGALFIWFTKKRQRVGDIAAKSVVVKVK